MVLAFMTFRYSPLPKSAQPHRVSSNADVYDFDLEDADMEALLSLDQGDSGAVTWNPVNAK
jgi:diketogulonate reductase-like aldo/keto reductase